MCCIVYYLYRRYCEYFREIPKQDNKEGLPKKEPLSKLKESEEYRYNAKQINDFVRNRQRQYWTNY